MQIIDNIKQAAVNFWQDKYKRKRTIIIAIFLAIFLSFVYVVSSWLKPDPSCTDGIRNQNEEDVDCGGICGKCEKISAQDLTVLESGIVSNGMINNYDAYGRISNPNNIYGSSEFKYEFKLKDSSGQILIQRSGEKFILPGESKYIIESNIVTDKTPATVELSITDPQWVEFKDYYEKPQLKVVNKQYNQITSGVGFSEAVGLLKNESPYDFSIINVEVILKDAANKVVGLNSTNMRTVRSGENREFKTLWMNRFSGDVTNMEVQSEVNVFDVESFSKKFFQGSPSQGSSYR